MADVAEETPAEVEAAPAPAAAEPAPAEPAPAEAPKSATPEKAQPPRKTAGEVAHVSSTPSEKPKQVALEDISFGITVQELRNLFEERDTNPAGIKQLGGQ